MNKKTYVLAREVRSETSFVLMKIPPTLLLLWCFLGHVTTTPAKSSKGAIDWRGAKKVGWSRPATKELWADLAVASTLVGYFWKEPSANWHSTLYASCMKLCCWSLSDRPPTLWLMRVCPKSHLIILSSIRMKLHSKPLLMMLV